MPRNRSEKHDPVRTYLMHRYLLILEGAEHEGEERKAWEGLTEAQREALRIHNFDEKMRIGKEAYDATKQK